MLIFGLIGTGKWGINHLKTLEKTSGINLKYICSPGILKKTEISDKYIKFRNYKDLLSLQDLDGIIIATPADTHFQIASEFLEKGVNIFVEKPLTLNFNDANKLREISKNKKNIFMVGHIDIYNPAFTYLQVNLKKVGTIKHIFCESGNLDLNKNRISVLWDWAGHGVAQANELLNQKPIGVSAWSDSKNKICDLVFVKLNYARDVNVYIKSSWITPNKKRYLEVVGQKGIFQYDDTIKKLSYYNFQNMKQDFVSFDKFSSPLENEIDEFKNAILSKKNPITDLDHAIDVVKVLEISKKSIKMNGKYLPL